jgi:hypothetical protein
MPYNTYIDSNKQEQKMKVYVVIEGVQYEGSTVLKVFSSESKANEYMEELQKNCKYSSYYYEVEEHELVD